MHHLPWAGSACISNSCNVISSPERLARIAITTRIKFLEETGKLARDLSGRRIRILSSFRQQINAYNCVQ